MQVTFKMMLEVLQFVDGTIAERADEIFIVNYNDPIFV